MATLVLNAVGTAIGGPIGGLIGSLVGAQVDRAIFGSSVEGTRLKDLTVQLASYGEPSPLVYGRARIAGTLIWSSGLIERKSKERVGGKTGSSVTTYSYYSSVAVALCGRSIANVGRVWGDGKLIRETIGGALTTGGIMRIYKGDEAQLPDTLIEAAVGTAQAPAHRGLAYVVIEELPLEEFANRVPNLTFEVIADDGALIDIAAVARDVIARAGPIALETRPIPGAVRGYAFARPQSARSALEALAVAAPFQTYEVDGALNAGPLPVQAQLSIPARWLGAVIDDGEPTPKREMQLQQDIEIPGELSLLFWDEARDYQSNVQRARTPGRTGAATQIEAPAVMTPDAARAVAEAMLDRQTARRMQRTLRLPLAALKLAPGDGLALADDPDDLWLVESVTLSNGAIEAALRREALTAPGQAAAPLASIAQTIEPAGNSTLVLLDLPLLPGQDDEPQLHAAIAGAAPGWRRASLFLSLNGGASYSGIADVIGGGTLGSVAAATGAADAGLWDMRNTIDVSLLRADMSLSSAGDEAVLAGANLCSIGSELIQFASAQLQPDGSYRLSRLLRGRYGTETAIDGHAAAETFVLLEMDSLARAALSLGDLGLICLGKAPTPSQSLGDVAGVALPFAARALRPYAPVHPRAARQAGGDWQLTWTRRGRTAQAWVDGTDAPVGEGGIAFDIAILKAGAPARTVRTSTSSFIYDAASQIADFGAVQTSLSVKIAQVSERVGVGDWASATFIS